VTNSEAIQKLLETVARLEERLDSARNEIDRVDVEQKKTADSLNVIDRKLAVIEDNVKDLKRIAEEQDRRRWMVVLSVIGCLLTLAANIGLTYFRTQRCSPDHSRGLRIVAPSSFDLG
jgi:hypothetical protein